MKKRFLILSVLLAICSIPALAQQEPRAVDLGLSVQWACEDIGPEADIPEGWRLPTLLEIKELREGCTQSVREEGGEERMVFTGKNGNSVSFLYPMGSRSAREFGIAGSDGCYLKVIILNPLLSDPGRDGYYTWEELDSTRLSQKKYPVRIVKE